MPTYMPPPVEPGPPVNAQSTQSDVPAVQGTSFDSAFVPERNFGSGAGILGTSGSGAGVVGNSNSGPGVLGDSGSGAGVLGTSGSGTGVQASSGTGIALQAISDNGIALIASNDTPDQPNVDALVAMTSSPGHAAVAAHNNSAKGSVVPGGYGLYAFSNNTAVYGQGNPAAYFDGAVHITGLAQCLSDMHVSGDLLLVNSSSADIAEDFDLESDPANAEPGTVLIIAPSGKLAACTEPYDTRVAGVVSGAGDLKAAIVLQRLKHRPNRSPLALVGKTLCKVDAAFGQVAAGDLLTTSAHPGHAMKVADRAGAVGAILGKALRPLDSGCGLVPILVSLR
jgi:hypothetical protein